MFSRLNLTGMGLVCICTFGLSAFAEPMEIYCGIRAGTESLNCQVLGKDRKTMSSEDITNFIDAGEVAAYITLRSRKGLDRTYLIDAKSPQYKKLNIVEKSASISEIARAKSDLFTEIEKKIIRVSDRLDAETSGAELVLFDSSLTYEKARRESHAMKAELENYHKNKESACTATPAFESVSKANMRFQQTLSNLVYAFQTQNSCMADYKIFKDHDGSVDLHQLDIAANHFKTNCIKK